MGRNELLFEHLGNYCLETLYHKQMTQLSKTIKAYSHLYALIGKELLNYR